MERGTGYSDAQLAAIRDVIAGLPALSVPCGFSDGLPVGMQLIGPHLSEARLLQIGHAYEQATEWHRQRPPI